MVAISIFILTHISLLLQSVYIGFHLSDWFMLPIIVFVYVPVTQKGKGRLMGDAIRIKRRMSLFQQASTTLTKTGLSKH